MPPKEPNILLSVINTKLSDMYSSLDDLCEDLDDSRDEIEDILRANGYEYNSSNNQFIKK